MKRAGKVTGGELVYGDAMARAGGASDSRPIVHRLTNQKHEKKERTTADSPKPKTRAANR